MKHVYELTHSTETETYLKMFFTSQKKAMQFVNDTVWHTVTAEECHGTFRTLATSIKRFTVK